MFGSYAYLQTVIAHSSTRKTSKKGTLISKLLNTIKPNDWTFLDISNDVLKSRYPWMNVHFDDNSKFPWAVETELNKLFQFCVSFDSSEQCLDFLKSHLHIDLNIIHKELISEFCYKTTLIDENIDDLIEKKDRIALLKLSVATLDRSLAWHVPSSSWMSDFHSIMNDCLHIIEKHIADVNAITNELSIVGHDFETYESHTHSFYRMENVCKLLEQGYLYDDMTIIAKQTVLTLEESIRIFHGNKYSALNDDDFEKKIEERVSKEIQWCKQKLTHSDNLEIQKP